MASTYSTNLKIELIGTGDQSGTWGTTTNNNFEFAVEEAVTGIGTANFSSDADLTLTLSNTNTTQVPRNLVLNVTSGVSLTTTRNLIVPTIEKQYLVWNNTTGGQSIVVKTSAGTGITVPNGAKAHVVVDGTNVVRAFDNVDINSGSIDGVVIGGASAAAGSFTTGSFTGNVTVGGTVDGRDVAADGTKLDTIETNADVTDTANVTAAGALMDSELTDIAAVKALDQGVATTDSPSFAGVTVSGTIKLDGNFPTGTNNVALGENALGDASLSGGTNTAIGDNALFSNTTGTANSALGGNAMYSNLSGQSNAAVGNAALFTNDTGSYNAAFGAGALYSNTASFNVAAGYRALYTNSTGADNVAVGYYALYTNSTGADNVAVGESALTVATGSSNTAVGAGAGSLITTGAKNTIIGAYDGNQGGLDIRTASNHIVLSDGDGNPRAYHNGTLWTFADLDVTNLSIAGTDITATATELNILDGVTATTAELNILDGVTATTTELNYLDITTLGTSQASKAVTADANGDVTLSEELKAKSYNETLVTVTSSGGAATLDCESGNVFTHTLSENVTYTFSNPPSSGTAYGFTLKVVQDTTARTITWPASVKWGQNLTPTISTGSGEVDVFTFFTHDGGTNWYGFAAGQDMS